MPRIVIQIPGGLPQPYRFDFNFNQIQLGRELGINEVVIPDASISKNHATITRVKDEFILRDAGSTNGITNNGQRVDEVILGDDSNIKLGNVAMSFELDSYEKEQLAASRIILPKATESSPGAELKHASRPYASNVPVRSEIRIVTKSSGTLFNAFMWVLILAAAGFGAGMAVRHYQDTGRSIMGDFHYEPPAAATKSGAKAAQ